MERSTGNIENVTNQQAYDELMRELNIRERLYGRWVKEGKLSRTQAREQLDRHSKACALLAGLPDVTANAGNAVDNEVPF